MSNENGESNINVKEYLRELGVSEEKIKEIERQLFTPAPSE